MSEPLDSFRAEKIRVDTELPTADGPNLQARQVIANRYEILAQLGKGGMGEVWRAFDVKLRVDVALKSLRLDIKRNDNAVEALRREVRTAREVISPNVCRIFDLVNIRVVADPATSSGYRIKFDPFQGWDNKLAQPGSKRR